MQNVQVVVGVQWGDEGKAKIVDYMAREHDIVVRFNGGANAGHTAEGEINGKTLKFVFHLMPAGALYPEKLCVIGNGVVLDPAQLMNEIRELESHDVSIRERLYLSGALHLVFDFHKAMDRKREQNRGSKGLGTTFRGIGPCYRDKAGRSGIRLIEALDLDWLKNRLEGIRAEYGSLLNDEEFGDIAKMAKEYHEFAKEFENRIVDTGMFLGDKIDEGQRVLLEGAQATFLDLDHGTYPYVSSSNASAGGACTGSGLGPRYVSSVLGVVKAYCTRVGSGAFPSEILPESQNQADLVTVNGENRNAGQYLREIGNEFGATTGRPRRTGWLDLVMLKKAIRVNSLSGLALTKLDVLDGIEQIPVCVAYEFKGKRIEEVPMDARHLKDLKPIYEYLPGWPGTVQGCTGFESLPPEARNYIKSIEDRVGVKVHLISTGPQRTSTLETRY